MNVLLISQCSGHALPETRRLLDQFAERRGERTWQTSVTQQGLDTIRRLLSKSARRNSSIACHWIRGRDRSELIWIVGNAARFNAEGAVPTNTTTLDVRRAHSENDWHHGEVIRLLAKLAALFHDVGKASRAFQAKLKAPANGPAKPAADAYRHEWVSLRMFMAFVGDAADDEAWLTRLAEVQADKKPQWMARLIRDDQSPTIAAFDPKAEKLSLARAVGWLIVSHHFLPNPDKGVVASSEQLKHVPKLITSAWNRARADASAADKAACWDFPKGTPFASANWCADVRRVAQSMLKQRSLFQTDWLANPYVAHLSRLCVMLADHHYSSLPHDDSRGDPRFPLYANTDRDTGQCKQHLDEHLMGVGYHAGYVARQLPRLERELPRVARHKGFVRRSADRNFAWQDRAYDLACSVRQKAADGGFFGVNMASTGCGKTLANGRIAYALADPRRGARFTIALGLRTLTLQTGEAYRQKLKLGADALAVRVGGVGVKELFEYAQELSDKERNKLTESAEAQRGSESAEPLLGADAYVHYEGSLPEGPMKAWLKDNRGALPLVYAPILVATIDHLIPATEGTRGGQQIAPMLRLMTSDLILDEPDDFDMDDLPALTRLVHWAALLGSRVLLSSATLPPALIQGLFAAYLDGRSVYQRNRGTPNKPANICCAWFDENGAATSDCADAAQFAESHRSFAGKRLAKLKELVPRRQAVIQPIDIASGQAKEVRPQWAAALGPAMRGLHAQHHCTDPKTGKRVSFGLIRMANIEPLIDTAISLQAQGAEPGQRIHLCCYHSQHPLVVRAAIERTLDKVLDRHKDKPADPDPVFKNAEVRARLDRSTEADHLFVVLATAVAEVGRDHDYDWAIVEPSSMRSIIQLAGRVKRHRDEPCMSPNIVLLGTNLRSLERPGQAAYCKPGFEKGSEYLLKSHKLADILRPEQYTPLDAAPRIVANRVLDAKNNLVDLEHARLAAMMATEGARDSWPVSLWWERPAAHLTGVLQSLQPFRKEHGQRERYILEPDEDENIVFKCVHRDGTLSEQQSKLHPIDVPFGPGIESWGTDSYLKLLLEAAEFADMTMDRAALVFGGLDLREKALGWRYHPQLGFDGHLG